MAVGSVPCLPALAPCGGPMRQRSSVVGTCMTSSHLEDADALVSFKLVTDIVYEPIDEHTSAMGNSLP
eukprot:6104996-Amphidinium_carterae.1